jgi:hypothetical protein
MKKKKIPRIPAGARRGKIAGYLTLNAGPLGSGSLNSGTRKFHGTIIKMIAT